MKFSIFQIIAALAGLAISATTPLHAPALSVRVPTSESNIASAIAVRDEQHLEKRATQAYFAMCENMNFGGRCTVSLVPWGLCMTLLDENDDWASSAFVSAGSTCTLYMDRICTGGSTVITSDGVLDLYPIGWDNKATSFRCQSI